MENEKRLIDANALKRKLVELEAEPDYQHHDEDWGVGVCMAEGIVDEMPTVDAVEVVRCKDCKACAEATQNCIVKLQEQIAELRSVQEWISVKDRLPTPFVSVLVQMPGEEPFPTVREGFISNDGIWQSAMFRREPGEVTHWQPMPRPPKGE